MPLDRRAAKQILAFGTLGGFILLSVVALVGFGGSKIDLVWGAWSVLTTKVMSDYFGDTQDEAVNDTR